LRCLLIRIIALDGVDVSRLPALLDPVPGLDIVGTATRDERGARSSIADADVVVVDAADVSGADLSELIAGVERPLVIVGVSHVDFDDFPPTSGGIALLKREAGVEELTAAIRAVAHALLVVDTRLFDSADAGRADRQPELVEPISSRELDVLRRMAEGWPNKQIARTLGISEHTVKFHVSAILSKLRARSRTEAVATAARRGLIAL
jgi:DNA-binding NarL/FixJ family response regulator